VCIVVETVTDSTVLEENYSDSFPGVHSVSERWEIKLNLIECL